MTSSTRSDTPCWRRPPCCCRRASKCGDLCVRTPTWRATRASAPTTSTTAWCSPPRSSTSAGSSWRSTSPEWPRTTSARHSSSSSSSATTSPPSSRPRRRPSSAPAPSTVGCPRSTSRRPRTRAARRWARRSTRRTTTRWRGRGCWPERSSSASSGSARPSSAVATSCWGGVSTSPPQPQPQPPPPPATHSASRRRVKRCQDPTSSTVRARCCWRCAATTVRRASGRWRGSGARSRRCWGGRPSCRRCF
mmetsp:Transcript_47038/g.117299  ORF Transcript_47038/g.117299 Transcript_47038/m.117299 type:complete len:249 (+) Transcript_47038:1994-2740(+)